MNIQNLSNTYSVRTILDCHLKSVYILCKENVIYYEYCPPMVTIDSLKEEMTALPPGKSIEDKYFIGFWQGDVLIAIMDLVDGYPDKHTAYIGLFMMHKHHQGKGLGSNIIQEVQKKLKLWGYKNIELAYALGNEQSKRFWEKNGFIPRGDEVSLEKHVAVPMKMKL